MQHLQCIGYYKKSRDEQENAWQDTCKYNITLYKGLEYPQTLVYERGSGTHPPWTHAAVTHTQDFVGATKEENNREKKKWPQSLSSQRMEGRMEADSSAMNVYTEGIPELPFGTENKNK